jgi:hypothetical protein
VYVGIGTFTMEGNASVSGNTASASPLSYASSYGGGVYVSYGTFRKTGGVIYGDTDATHTAGSTENTATSGLGHGVYLNGGKRRNATAGAAVNLYAARASSGGSWSYNDTSGGAGDTTANWE